MRELVDLAVEKQLPRLLRVNKIFQALSAEQKEVDAERFASQASELLK
jgi:hypothetical protein